MTAVLACVNGPSVLITSDSRRAFPIACLFPVPIVAKIYSWGGGVLFGQAGSGPALARLAADMIAQARAGLVTMDEPGFLDAFARLHRVHYTGAPGVAGTFLVAVAQTPSASAHIFNLDFATGISHTHASNVAAIGTNPTAFVSYGTSVFPSHTAGAGGSLSGDTWAGDCIANAISAYPGEVGLPFDIAVSAPRRGGVYVATQSRFYAAPTVGLPEFSIP